MMQFAESSWGFWFGETNSHYKDTNYSEKLFVLVTVYYLNPFSLMFWLTLKVNSNRRLIHNLFFFCKFWSTRSFWSLLCQCWQSVLITAVFYRLSTEAKFHRGIISGTSSYSSNKYVSVVQTVQVVEPNADCVSGWQPCNLRSSCCILTE